MLTHNAHLAEEHHIEEQKQVGCCAAAPLLAVDLTNRAENVTTQCHPVAESCWESFVLVPPRHSCFEADW